MLKFNEIKSIVSSLCEKYGVKKAYLFGSYARGEATENSDVDLIIEKGNLKTYSDYYYFYDELEKNLGSNADLISSEKNLLPRFRTAINRDRILLYGL